ncbi:ras association domain-containing protein 5 [Cricetulus griseus]|nr:ras association domain-containing protein 5 [Cricetulus griseus]
MREGPDEEVVAACFSTVAVCLQRLFQRLPRSQELSEKLQTPQRLCGKALAHDCKFTCHPECRSLIQLDCRQKEGPALDRHSPESTLTPTFNQGKKSIDFQQLTEAVLYECSCILFVQAFVPVCVCGTGEGTWSLVHSPEAFTIYR